MDGNTGKKTSWMHFSRSNLYGVEKMSSILNSYPIWHLTFLHKVTVCGSLCMWVAFFFGFFRRGCIYIVVFSFCYTLNHQFKGEKRLLKQYLFSLDKYHIFWIHFEFSSSDGKLVKFCIEPQTWKIVTKFSAPPLSHDHTREQVIYFWTHLFCIEFPELWCKDAGNNFHTVRKGSVGLCILFYLKHYLNVTLLHHWWSSLVLLYTIGLSLPTTKRGKVVRGQAVKPGGAGFMNEKPTVEF